MFKRFWVSAFFLTLLLVTPVMAAEDGIPEFDSLCWQKAQCWDIRAQVLAGKEYGKVTDPIVRKQIEEGFFPSQGTCTGGQDTGTWGKCLPSTLTRTSISFGGKNTFTDIGDFLKTNYNYVLGLAAILSVFMIVVAGFQWVLSAGNSESITSAKNRISGALIGLFIAYSSFLILRTVNPALVALRLPQSWMIRPQALIPTFCAQATSTFTFSKASTHVDQMIAVSPAPSAKYDLKFSQVHEESFNCGSRFFLKNGNLSGGGQTCFGNVCDPGSSCVLLARDDDQVKANKQMKYGCKAGQLFVRYNVVGLQEIGLQGALGGLFSDLESPTWLQDKSAEFWPVCKDANGKSIVGTKTASDLQLFDATSIKGNPFDTYNVIYAGFDKKNDWCANGAEPLGFVYKVEVKIHLNVISDANWVIGNNGVAGRWGTDVTVKNYIPYKDLVKNGVSFTVDLDGHQINELVNTKYSNPE